MDTAYKDPGPLIPRNRAKHPPAYDVDYKTAVTRSPRLPLLSLESTLTEETGPVFGHDTGADHNHGDLPRFLISPQGSACFQAIEDRHLIIH